MVASIGTERTRRFSDRSAWRQGRGPVDRDPFGTREDGPIRRRLHELHTQRVQTALRRARPPLDLLECGCGGGPEPALFELCSRYTGTDASETGLARARRQLLDLSIPHELVLADVCDLPFESERFDAVYCAHVLYHLSHPSAQAKAILEMVRVVRPGGVVVLVVANPRPLLFPIRLARRIIADTRFVGRLVDGLRPPPPLPYRPMRLGWMQRQLGRWGGTVDMRSYALPSTAFHQRVSEHEAIGRRLWQATSWLEHRFPRASAYLGNYVLLTLTKAGN